MVKATRRTNEPLSSTRKQKTSRKKFYARKLVKIPTAADVLMHQSLETKSKAHVVQDMLAAYLSVKKKSNILFLDIDGTVMQYRDFDLDCENTPPRPYLDRFMKKVAPLFDIVLYTAANFGYAAFIWKRFFRKHACLFFWNHHLVNKKKIIEDFLPHADNVIALDDEVRRYSDSAQKHVLAITTWRGEKPDTMLLQAAETIGEKIKGKGAKSSKSPSKTRTGDSETRPTSND